MYSLHTTIRYDTIGEFNVDSKAEYSALSSTRSQKLKQTKQCPFNTVQVKIREGSPEVTRVTMEERICERDEFNVWSERSRKWQMARTKVVTVMRLICV